MKNAFGQEITIGSIIGLGIRAGDVSEQRVGIVLELFPKTDPYGREQWYAKATWASPQWYWDPRSKLQVQTGFKLMTSQQMFRFFLLDEESLDPDLLMLLDTAFQDYQLVKKPASDFVAPAS